jgi:uncharacterized OB-fold protein
MAAARKSLEPKVFRVGERGPGVLLGSRCDRCERVFFPAQEWCAACCAPCCHPIELSHQGELKSYAVVYRKTSYSLVTPPYILGEIALPEGVLVYATINLTSSPAAAGYSFHTPATDDDLAGIFVGQRVTLNPVIVKRDDEGNDILAYNFCTTKT